MIIIDVYPKQVRETQYIIPEGIQSCQKIFPLEFILIGEGENDAKLYDLFDYCTENIDDKVAVRINLLSYKYSYKKRIKRFVLTM